MKLKSVGKQHETNYVINVKTIQIPHIAAIGTIENM